MPTANQIVSYTNVLALTIVIHAVEIITVAHRENFHMTDHKHLWPEGNWLLTLFLAHPFYYNKIHQL